MRQEKPMTPHLRAYSVHLLTATGAIFAMLAMLEASRGDWPMMFLWLVVAFAVDGIDGPLARRFGVQQHAPQVDGVLMDLIIDYLTYVFIPAYALFQSGLLPGWPGWLALLAIVFTSAIYFADTRMKTKDNSFAGFPGCWNMLVLVLFAVSPPPLMSLALVIVLAGAMFTELKFIHPVRTQRWRAVSLPVAFGWTFFAFWAAWVEFDAQSWAIWGLVATSVYLLLAGIAQQLTEARQTA
jgi:phosphatidylcholine synthase